MSDNKDFLNQFSNQGKPASFQEEERIPVTKQRKPLNVKLLIGLLIAAIALGILAYFLFFAPKIEVPNFVGKTKNDVAAWTKQQGIEQSGILFDERYDFDTDEGIIISQSIPEGKKVKNNVKMDFVISLGADPEEKIKVPDIKNMNKDEIQNWVSQNKLSKTRVMTAYNDEVEENEVIDYSFSGCEEDTFTRGCSLRINISKGSAPAGKITVEDFEKKLYETAETWAKTKKVNLVKVEQYSDKIEKGYIISQSVASGKTIDEGGELIVTVSLGKAITVPNFIGWSKENISKWAKTNQVSLDPEGGHDNDGRFEYDYSGEPVGNCIKQTPAANTILKDDYSVHIWISKGHPDISEFIGEDVTQKSLYDLEKWIKEVNIDSGRLSLDVVYELNSLVSSGNIISIVDEVRVGSTVYVTVSEGKNYLLKFNNTDFANQESVENWHTSNPDIKYEFKYIPGDESENGIVKKYYRSDGKEVKTNTYIPENERIIFEIVDSNQE